MIPMIGLMVASIGIVVSLYVMTRLLEGEKGRVGQVFEAIVGGLAFMAAIVNILLLIFLAWGLFSASLDLS